MDGEQRPRRGAARPRHRARPPRLERRADPLGALGHLGAGRADADPDLAARLVERGGGRSRRTGIAAPRGRPYRSRRPESETISQIRRPFIADWTIGLGLDSSPRRHRFLTIVHEADGSRRSRRTSSAPTGSLEPPGALPQRGRAARSRRPGARRTSSRSRSSGCASTRPRSATSASAAAPTRTRWRSGSWRSSPARGKMHNPETDSGGILLGTRHRGRRALQLAAPSSAHADRHPRLADADAAAPRRGDRPRPRLAAGRASRAPPTCSSARAGRRSPTTCRSRPRSTSSTSAPRPPSCASWSRWRHRLRARRRPRGQARAGRRPRRDARRDGGRRRRRRRRRSSSCVGSASATSAWPPTSATRSRRWRRCGRPASRPPT